MPQPILNSYFQAEAFFFSSIPPTLNVLLCAVTQISFSSKWYGSQSQLDRPTNAYKIIDEKTFPISAIKYDWFQISARQLNRVSL
jgi:hypothetical protein